MIRLAVLGDRKIACKELKSFVLDLKGLEADR